MKILYNYHIVLSVAPEFFDQGDGYGIVACQDDVIKSVFGQFARGTAACFRFHPWSKKELYEDEGQQDQEKHNSGHEHQDRKGPAWVLGEGDVTETEGGHYHECPVKTGDPGMFLPLCYHEEVKDHTVDGYHPDESEQVFQKHTDIPLGYLTGEHRGEKRR